MDLGRYRLVVGRPRRWPRLRVRSAVASVAALTLILVLAAPTPVAADGGAASGYVELPEGGLRSISASPPGFDYAECYGIDGGQAQATVEIPSGMCESQNGEVGDEITVINGQASADILVEGTEFDPSDGATPWVLCVPDVTGMPPGPMCEGSGSDFPGADQARLQLTDAPRGYFDIGNITTVSDTPSCDLAFDQFVRGQPGGCAASSGQSQYETPLFRAPTSSTDQSPVFSNTITWIAAPQGS